MSDYHLHRFIVGGTCYGEPPMRRSDAAEKAAMYRAAYEEVRGWTVQNVSEESRGYDPLNQGPEGEIRDIEVKGSAGVAPVELTASGGLKAEQLQTDYWLYVVTDALSDPDLHQVQDRARRFPGAEVQPQVRYQVSQQGWL